MVCLTCEEECKSHLALARHVKYTHKMTSEEYYNYHFGKKDEKKINTSLSRTFGI